MRIAQDLHKTRAELLNGHPTPLSSDEYALWLAWYDLEREDAEKEMEKAQRKR